MPAVAPVPSSTDLSALAWVHDELRRTLESAHKAMRRYLKEVEAARESDIGAPEPGVLRQARAQLHQGVGALELVRLPSAAQMLRASEAALNRLQLKPKLLTPQAVATVEQGSFALLEYLSRMLARKPVSALLLFPQYRAIQELAGSDRIHPADLWQREWQWMAVPADPTAQPRQPDAKARGEMEALMLSMLREPSRSVMLGMSDLCAGLGASAQGPVGDNWKLAAGFFQAQGLGLLQVDLYAKRIASRLLMQLKLAQKGEAEVSELLAKDLLFFCAHAQLPQTASQAARWAAVRTAYGLDSAAIVDYETPRLGQFDPAWLAQGRKRVAAAKDVWSAVTSGERTRQQELAEQFNLVGETLKRLYPNGEALAQALEQAVAAAVRTTGEPPAALAMEVATSMLYLEASLDDAEFDHPDMPQRVQRLAQRIADAARGHPARALDGWMEELYRRVSDRQMMGSVVQELRASLGEVETQVDRYFRDPSQREVLIPVPAQLKAMRGVLSVLNMDQASQAVQRMSEDVDHLCASATPPTPEAARASCDRVADNLSALSFMIDMLNVQPHLAKALFRFDAEHGSLRTVMAMADRVTAFGGLEPTPVAQADAGLLDRAAELAVVAERADVSHDTLTRDLERMSQHALLSDQPELAQTMDTVRAALEHAADEDERLQVRAGLAQAMHDFAETTHGAALDPAAAAAAAGTAGVGKDAAPPAHAPLPEAEQLDDEMREIFIEEAREVVQGAQESLQRLLQQADDVGDLTSVRRAFHTLKGSSRMVGLNDFGAAAWACEQLYNAQMAQSAQLSPALADFTGPALEYFEGWVEALAERRDAGHQSPGLVAAADALRLGGVVSVAAPAAVPAAVPMAVDAATVMDMPLDMARDVVAAEPSLPVSEAMPLPEATEASLAEASEAMALFEQAAADKPLPPADLAELAPPSLAEAVPEAASAIEPEQEPALEAVLEPELEPEPEPVKIVGPLRISIPLFNIYLNEADELSRRLCTELAEWALQLHEPLPESAVSLAHSLAGSSATVGYADLSSLARALEHALSETRRLGQGEAQAAALFNESAEEIRRLLHQFAAGFLHPVPPSLLQRLLDQELATARAAAVERPPVEAPITAFGVEPLLDEVQLAERLAEEVAAVAEVPEAALPEAIKAVAASEQVQETPLEPEVKVLQVAASPTVAAAPIAAAAPLVAPVFSSSYNPTMLGALPALDVRAAAHVQASDAEHDDDIDAVDAIDAELFPIFCEEAEELLPALQAQVREWARNPASMAPVNACMRNLHTFKGGARLAGAMRLGEMAHRMESAMERVMARGHGQPADVEEMAQRADALQAVLEKLQRQGDVAPLASTTAAVAPAAPVAPAAEPFFEAVVKRQPEAVPESFPVSAPVAAAAPPALVSASALPATAGINWAAYAAAAPAQHLLEALPALAANASAALASVRVKAPLLDRLVNHAGEVSIARSRIDTQVQQMRSSLDDLSENLSRLRTQLRDIELQAESQIASRMEAARSSAEGFDPLEMDRFTRLQELTRMMAESVADVATVQRGLERGVHAAEDDLAAQARLSRELQEDLLRTRMVEFEGLADRLYRVVRQAAKETGKQVRLDLIGGSIEVDRGVLDRVVGPLEHLLRNAVVHGIEAPAVRQAAGKEAAGVITLAVRQEGNEVDVECRDDGAGLNIGRIRSRALQMGLLKTGEEPAPETLANFIFTPGFSTVEAVSELAGRGVGMDVVRAEVSALGGRIETASAPGQGTSFRLVLPLTTAVTQVVMLRSGSLQLAVPSTLVEVVLRLPTDSVRRAYATGVIEHEGISLPLYWLGGLLQSSPASLLEGKTQAVLLMRSAAQRLALHVDEVQGNQEVVVKHLGPQLARLPGLAGMTLLPSGGTVLIYNPVALAALYGPAAVAGQQAAVSTRTEVKAQAVQADAAPLVLVVDDSLTVRRVTQRLLQREGYRVGLAKDGLDALEKIAQETPAVVLSDIEMPRMDGFDLVRNLRADGKHAELPVIMITSRLAQKHRDYAAELGVDHYLGKPYAEDELLSLVGRYAKVAATLN